MMRLWMMVLVLLLVTAAPAAGWAKKVYSPRVEQGALELETQTDVVRSADPAADGAIKQQTELAYGVTSWWNSGLYVVHQKAAGASAFRFLESKWANIFTLPTWDRLGIDWGVYAEYIHPSASTAKDVLEAKLLFEERSGRWSHTMNLVLKQKLGGGAAGLGYAWRTRYQTVKAEVSLEAYGDLGTVANLLPLGRQRHLLGPVVTVEPWDRFELEAGWLMDTRTAPGYGTFKLNMEFAF